MSHFPRYLEAPDSQLTMEWPRPLITTFRVFACWSPHQCHSLQSSTSRATSHSLAARKQAWLLTMVCTQSQLTQQNALGSNISSKGWKRKHKQYRYETTAIKSLPLPPPALCPPIHSPSAALRFSATLPAASASAHPIPAVGVHSADPPWASAWWWWRAWAKDLATGQCQDLSFAAHLHVVLRGDNVVHTVEKPAGLSAE